MKLLNEQYLILSQDYFDIYTDANVVIQYILSHTGDTYEIGIASKHLHSEEDVINWFSLNYSSRPVTMIGYCIKENTR